MLNATFETLGFSRQPWLLRPDLAMCSVILVGVWADLGFYALIILAGLQGIPPVLYEAATMSGAGRWDRFRHIVLPLLLPTLFVVLVLTIHRPCCQRACTSKTTRRPSSASHFCATSSTA